MPQVWVRILKDLKDICWTMSKSKYMERNNDEEHDWFDDLSDEQQQTVLTGIEQLDNGEFITHEDAMIRLGL